jgi:hypothetical protein
MAIVPKGARKRASKKSAAKAAANNEAEVAEVQAQEQQVQAQDDTAQDAIYVSETTYNRYTSLLFAELSGVEMTAAQKKEMAQLKAEIEQADGQKASKTITACIKAERIKLVEGLPMPENFYTIIKNGGAFAVKYYLINE